MLSYSDATIANFHLPHGGDFGYLNLVLCLAVYLPCQKRKALGNQFSIHCGESYVERLIQVHLRAHRKLRDLLVTS